MNQMSASPDSDVRLKAWSSPGTLLTGMAVAGLCIRSHFIF